MPLASTLSPLRGCASTDNVLVSFRSADVGLWQTLLQKSKVASVRIFGEILMREAMNDSDNLSHATEVAYELA
jgi:hypothetical protein